MKIEEIKNNLLNNIPFEMDFSKISLKAGAFDGMSTIQLPARPNIPDYTPPGGNISPTTTWAPGYAQPTTFSQVFLTDLIQATPILDNSRYIPMSTKSTRIPKMDADIQFENIRAKGISGEFGQVYDKANEQGKYAFTDDFLDAKEMVARFSIHEYFLKENLEGQGFLNHISSFMSQKASVELQNIFLYGRIPATSYAGSKYTAGIPSSYTYQSGIIENIEINQMVAPNPVTSAEPLKSLAKYIKWASSVKPSLFPGKPSITPNNFIAYLPPSLLLDIQFEASQRETTLGDNYIVGRGQMYDTFYNVPLIPVDALETPKDVITYAADTAGNAAHAREMAKKVILTTPNNITYGIFDQIKTRFQFDLRDLAYIGALTLASDQKILFPRYTSYATIDETGGILGLYTEDEGIQTQPEEVEL